MAVNGSMRQYEDCDGDETLSVRVEARLDAPISASPLDTLMATTPTRVSFAGQSMEEQYRAELYPSISNTICQEPELMLRNSRRPPWRLQRQGNRHLRAGERVLAHPGFMEHHWPRRQR
jgi:hypothetical protein